MATEKIIIAKIEFKNNWYNITDHNNRELSVYAADDKNPNLAKQLSTSKVGDEFEADVKIGKDGVKLFCWDIKTAGGGFGGGKSYQPADKSFEAGKVALQAAATLYAGKELTPETVTALAKHLESFHKYLMSKVTAKPVEPAK